MPMHVQVKVNGLLVEELKLQRLEALREGRDDYTYRISYRRRAAHRTFKQEPPAIAYVEHNFEDGSLILIRNAIDTLLEQSTKRRFP